MESAFPLRPAWVFVDSGGQATGPRHWGGLFVYGNDARALVGDILGNLKNGDAARLTESGELKGRDLADSEIHGVRRSLAGSPIVGWFNSYPAFDTPVMKSLAQHLAGALEESNSRGRNPTAALSHYFASLKPINQAKLASLFVHIQRLAEIIRADGVGPEIELLHLSVDRENFPEPAVAAQVLKIALAGLAATVGVRVPRASAVLKQAPDKGNVQVDLNVDSSQEPGIELIDILIQGMNRGLDGFPPGWVGDENETLQ